MGSTIQVKDGHVRMTIPLIDSDVRDGSATTKIVGSFKEMAVGVKEVAENEVCVVVSLRVQVLDAASSYGQSKVSLGRRRGRSSGCESSERNA
jgi:hypothetical protein